jgi:serine/threonine protein kinase
VAQEIAEDIIKQVVSAGWLVPPPHEPFDEGGGAHVYLCYKRDLVASLESFARSTAPVVGARPDASGELACKALGALHHALIVDKTAVAVLKVPKLEKGTPQRARREVDAMRKLSAPGLTALFAADDGEPTRWFVMQYHPRGTIATARGLYSGNSLMVLRGALQVAKALVQVHALPLVHRDIKPSNIFLGDNGEWILGDFGIALDVDRSRLTRPGEVLWSRDWMPDWMTDRAEAESSPVVDIYMLTLTAYWMITGRKPRASQMDEPEFDLRRVFPADPHMGMVAEFFHDHLVSKEQKVASRTATDFCRRLERMTARLAEQATSLLLLSFISSYATTDISPNGRPFSAMVMTPRPCRRIAVAVRGSQQRREGVLRLTLGDEQHTIPLGPDENGWATLTGFNLATPLPEGPVFAKAEAVDATISGLLVWAV